jgi:hypothetical protein
MKFKLLAAVLLIASFSCQKTADELPVTPPTLAEAISGSYTASTHNVFSEITAYPINGQTIKLLISAVSTDKVRVEIHSAPNGVYSPGSVLVYPEVTVKQREGACNTCTPGLPVFQLDMAPPTHAGSLENAIWFDHAGRAYYTYIPPNYTKGAVQTTFLRTGEDE